MNNLENIWQINQSSKYWLATVLPCLWCHCLTALCCRGAAAGWTGSWCYLHTSRRLRVRPNSWLWQLRQEEVVAFYWWVGWTDSVWLRLHSETIKLSAPKWPNHILSLPLCFRDKYLSMHWNMHPVAQQWQVEVIVSCQSADSLIKGNRLDCAPHWTQHLLDPWSH